MSSVDDLRETGICLICEKNLHFWQRKHQCAKDINYKITVGVGHHGCLEKEIKAGRMFKRPKNIIKYIREEYDDEEKT